MCMTWNDTQELQSGQSNDIHVLWDVQSLGLGTRLSGLLKSAVWYLCVNSRKVILFLKII